jgi:anti-sigma B factor antagonist
MNISDETIDGVAVVHLEGNLDTTTAPGVQTHLDRRIDGGANTLIVDFGAVDFVSSAGLRVLLATAKKLRPDGILRLYGLNDSVREVFDVSGFSTIIPIFDDQTSALAG